MTAEFNELLNFDPLDAAEQLTGKSYKDDEETLMLGIALQLTSSKQKEEELGLRDDTSYNTEFTDYLRIAADLGFTEIFSQEFPTSAYENDSPEQYKVLWNDGVLMTVESYGTRVNSAKVYYNWKPSVPVYVPTEEREAREAAGERITTAHEFTSSGHWKVLDENDDSTWVWAGDHDARTGLRNTLDNLRGNGTLLPVWIDRPFLWFLNYSNKRTDDYKSANAQVLATFPQDVLDAITPAK